jgi:hypothetical protein
MDTIKFFSDSDNLTTINDALHLIESKTNSQETFENNRNFHIAAIIEKIISNPSTWDKLCQFNISKIGNKFITHISSIDIENKKNCDLIFSMCIRFAQEFEISSQKESHDEIRMALYFAEENIDKLEESAAKQIRFASFGLPISILKELSNSKSIKNLNELEESLSKAQAERNKIEESLSKYTTEVGLLKKSLETYKNGFNFVGLFEGFDLISTTKKTELETTKKLLIFIAILAILPITAELAIILTHIQKLNEIKSALIAATIPGISLTVIFIYFFRVTLLNHRSIQSQLLQIELRKTLCRFIQHYSDYSKTIKSNDKESLAKFENIIFSELSISAGSIPTAYDGIESAIKAFKTIKP